jgi:hypothetical protein
MWPSADSVTEASVSPMSKNTAMPAGSSISRTSRVVFADGA